MIPLDYGILKQNKAPNSQKKRSNLWLQRLGWAAEWRRPEAQTSSEKVGRVAGCNVQRGERGGRCCPLHVEAADRVNPRVLIARTKDLSSFLLSFLR